MTADPYGYYARKAQREADIRASAPYRIDDQSEIISDYDALVERLSSVSLALDCERRRDGRFAIYDPAFGYLCGYVSTVTYNHV